MPHLFTDTEFPIFIETIARDEGVNEDVLRSLRDAYAERSGRVGLYVSDPEDIERFGCLMISMRGKNSSGDIFKNDLSKHNDFEVALALHSGAIRSFKISRPVETSIDDLITEISCMDTKEIDRLQRKSPSSIHLFHGSSWCANLSDRIINHIIYGDEFESYGLSRKTSGKMVGTAKARARMLVRLAQKTFREAISPGVLRAGYKITRLDLPALSWMSGDGTAFSRKARLQALNVYPTFINLFIANAKVTEDIDRGRPLVPSLSTHAQITPAVLRRLRSLNWRWAGTSPNRMTLTQFSGLDPNDFPKSIKDARRLQSLCEMKSEMIGEFDMPWSIAPGRPQDMMLVADAGGPFNVYDALEFILSFGVMPALRLDEDHRMTNKNFHTMKHMIFRKIGVRGMLQMSTTWHDQYPRLRAMLRGDDPDEMIRWTPLVGSGVIDDNICFEEITGPSDLDNLGEDQNHCIATYLGQVLYADDNNASFVFKLHADGLTMSTVFIRAERLDERWCVRIDQQQAKGNTPPCEQAVAAAHKLVPMVNAALTDVTKLENHIQMMAVMSQKLSREHDKNNPVLQDALINMLPKALRSREALHTLFTSAPSDL